MAANGEVSVYDAYKTSISRGHLQHALCQREGLSLTSIFRKQIVMDFIAVMRATCIDGRRVRETQMARHARSKLGGLQSRENDLGGKDRADGRVAERDDGKIAQQGSNAGGSKHPVEGHSRGGHLTVPGSRCLAMLMCYKTGRLHRLCSRTVPHFMLMSRM